jgi:hypothetical protein
MLKLLLIFLLSVPVMAQDESPKATTSNDSSEYHRQNKKFSIVAQPIGIYVLPTIGASLGYYYSDRDLIELDFTSGNADFLIFELHSSTITARWKRFFGNSFYANFGLTSRSMGGETKVKSILTTEEDVDVKYSVSSVGLDVGIGNRWQWEYFSLGCDWVGYFMPISKGDVDDDIPEARRNDPEYQESHRKTREDFKDLGESPNLYLLRFYLGASF